MGCFITKDDRKVVYEDQRTHQKSQIRIEIKNTQINAHKQNQEEKQISSILLQVKTENTTRKPKQILEDVIKLSQKCIHFYNQHEIDSAYEILQKIQKDIKELQQRGYKVEMDKHFQQEFIELSHIIKSEYDDMINFNNEILKKGWKLQKDKNDFKVFSRVEESTVGIRLQSVLNVPFENFIAVLIQPNHYNEFLPFIKLSKEVKNVRRNCKLGTMMMSFPIISDREAYFQGVVYNRLNNKHQSEQQLFLYTRSIHNRKDLQEEFKYEVIVNQKCVQLDYKYLVVKYVPLSETSGKMTLGVNIDLKLNMLPLPILEMVSISFSKEFFDNLVRISKNFEGSIWEQGIKKDPQLFEFTKRVKNEYLGRIIK